MKSLLFIFSILCFYTCLAQDPLSKETGKIIIDIYIDGYQSGDTLKMKSVMHPNITMQTAYVNKEQENLLLYLNPTELLKYSATSAKEQNWSEKITDYVVSSDGNIAHVWTPYEFYLNDKFSHCGANSFTLVYTDESWKILNLIESRRLGSCKQE